MSTIVSRRCALLPARVLLVVALAGCGDDSVTGGPVEGERCLRLDDCVTDLFFKLSSIYRPSGGEDAVVGYLTGLVDYANQYLWNGQVGTEKDAFGNFVIRLPASGQFRDSGLPPIILQAHLDMVIQVTSGNEQALMRQLLTEGVRIEAVDGYYQSVARQTTLGADDGIGVAMALRYLLDKSLPHPPLELVFTVEEERGLLGASAFEIPLQSSLLLSLDWTKPRVVGTGALGAQRAGVKGSFAAARVAGFQIFRLVVSDLKGGHSGHDIDKPRANAIKLMARILTEPSLLGSFNWQIVSAVSGRRAADGVPMGLNAIPTAFDLYLALPTPADPRSRANSIRDYITTMYADELDPKVTLSMEAAEPTMALSRQDSQNVVTALDTALNGVLIPSTEYPVGWSTSSNLGFLEIQVASATEMFVDVAYMARSYVPNELQMKSGELSGQLLAAWSTPNQPGTDYEIRGYAPWKESADSWLVRLALAQSDHFDKSEVSSGGLEPGIFKANTRYCPNLKTAISIGPEILDAHSVNERLRIDTIKPAQEALQHLIVQIAGAQEFTNPAP